MSPSPTAAEPGYRRGVSPRLGAHVIVCDSCRRRRRPVLVTLTDDDGTPRAFWVCRECSMVAERR